jgi:hypothetical protein
MSQRAPNLPHEVHAREAEITKAREAWIARYAGYFGDPIRLDEYRRGAITFTELYRHSKGHAEDMVTEATRCDYAAMRYRE